MKKHCMIIGLTLVGWLLLAGAVCAQENNSSAATTVQVAVLLAPLVAAATVIERIIETIFSWYEGLLLNASHLLGLGGGYVKWMREEVKTCQDALTALAHKGNAATVSDLTAIRKAEEALAAAQDRLLEWLKSPFYTNGKRLVSLLLGMALGIGLAFATRLRMFALLGIQPVGASANLGSFVAGMDMLVTGLVIGTGSAPVHSLIGLLQNTRDAVDQARALWSGRAISEVGDALRQAQTEVAPKSVQPLMDIGPADARREAVPAPQPMGEIEFRRLTQRMLR
jgi:hypothetical protein